jgi:hypothetical protein
VVAVRSLEEFEAMVRSARDGRRLRPPPRPRRSSKR